MGQLEEMAMYERIYAEMGGDFGEFEGIPEGAAAAGEFALSTSSAVEAAWDVKRPLSRELIDEIRAEHPFQYDGDLAVWKLMLKYLDEIPVKDPDGPDRS
ncbi:hypothetical protein [Rhodococcus sp. ACT016]|uniref:hypothetical protein n=1 Tax=Rhodococcus sp. ACT016 TaxID=3134808 RepID=UPI003D2B981A